MIIILGVDDLGDMFARMESKIAKAIQEEGRKTVSSVTETLQHIDAKLTEAGQEISKKIQDLIDANADVLSDEDKATLTSISTNADALADIVPDAPSPTQDGSSVGDTGELPPPDDNEAPVAEDGSNPGQL